MQQIRQETFDVVDAIGGCDLIVDNGSGSSGYSSNVTNFRRDTSSSYNELYPYIGTVNGVQYHFDVYGNCKEDSSLSLKKSTTTESYNEDIGLGTITELNPREQIALTALSGILQHIDNPLELTDYKIGVITNMAFRIANSMLNVAASTRSRDSEIAIASLSEQDSLDDPNDTGTIPASE